MRSARVLLGIAVAGAALAAPGAASAAPTVTASATPSTPQDCQAGCIQSVRLACTATEALSVRTTVSCWIDNQSAITGTQDGPAAFANGVRTGSVLRSFRLCVQGTSRYADGTTSTSPIRCTYSEGGAAVVAG